MLPLSSASVASQSVLHIQSPLFLYLYIQWCFIIPRDLILTSLPVAWPPSLRRSLPYTCWLLRLSFPLISLHYIDLYDQITFFSYWEMMQCLSWSIEEKKNRRKTFSFWFWHRTVLEYKSTLYSLPFLLYSSEVYRRSSMRNSQSDGGGDLDT